MVDPQTTWLFGLGSMLLVFLYFHFRTGSIRYSFMVSLLWGKILAGTFWVLGLDYPLLTVYALNPYYGPVPIFTVTGNMAIFLLLLTTNAAAAAWPELKRELGLRRAGELPGLPRKR